MTYANPYDWVSPSMSAFLLVTGTILFPACFWLQQYCWRKTATGRDFIKAHQLTEKDTIDISNKIVSAIQALCAGVSGVIVVSHCHQKVLNCRQTVTLGYAWFGIPYFLYDTLCMFYVYSFTRKQHNFELISTTKYLLFKAIEFGRFATHSPVIFIHHVIMAHVGWTLILFYRDPVEPGDFFVGVMYMMEFSTPFVSIRFILSKLKMKSSIWYRVNGIIMLIAFPIFRIFSVIYAAYLFTWQNNHANILQGIMAVPLHWRTIWMVAMTPQLYWYFLMVRGLVKMYSEGEPKAKESHMSDRQVNSLLWGNASDLKADCGENSRESPQRTDATESDRKFSATSNSNAVSNSNNQSSNASSTKQD